MSIGLAAATAGACRFDSDGLDGGSGGSSSSSSSDGGGETFLTTASTPGGPSTDDSTTIDPDSTGADVTTQSEVSTGDCPAGEEGCACDVGSTCAGELVCQEGVCRQAPVCNESEGEPNDDEDSAVQLAEAFCGADPMATAGGLDGGESDWFTYHAQDVPACFERPSVIVTADVDLAVCIFAECDMGGTTVTCSDGADASDSPGGRRGCCDQNTVGIGDMNCGLNGLNATVFVRVTSVEPACVVYGLAWEY